MIHKNYFYQILRRLVFLVVLLLPIVSQASFIEATMGTAVVNDATAAYFNPAALVLLDNNQIVLLGTAAELHSEFNGTVTQTPTGFSQTGSSPSHTNYFLPTAYVGAPLSDQFYFGLAVLGNSFNRDMDSNTILRYVTSDNNVRSIDLVPALGFKINKYFSIGAGLNFSQANFLQEPTSGFPSLDVPDAQSHNDANAYGLSGDVGMLIKPFTSTIIGLNYRGAMTYHFKGTSMLENNPTLVSNFYSFDFWTPARYVFSINQFLSKSFGLIGTVQWIEWDIFDNITNNGIVTQKGPTPVILSNVVVPMHYRNGGAYTAGAYYRFSPKWILRTAVNYLQSPGNPNYQITNGDDIIVGASLGYQLSKSFLIDTSYAHDFVKNQTIDIQNSRTSIYGVNTGYRDSVSLKLTANLN